MSATAPTKAARYGAPRQKVPAFARFEGTSAWRKDKKKVRAYTQFRAAQAAKDVAST